MGAYLDQPNTNKNPESGKAGGLDWGACAMQGWRCGMEDAHVVFEVKKKDNNAACATVFGVFDGHGGKEVAEFCKSEI